MTTCLGGSFYVQDGIDHAFGFGIYAGGPTSWVDADGYLPAQVTTFHRSRAVVTITEFADRVVLGGNPYVAVYCRVTARESHRPATGPRSGPLGRTGPPQLAGRRRPPRPLGQPRLCGGRRSFRQQLSLAHLPGAGCHGGFDGHFAHMRSFSTGQLAHVAEVDTPDRQLDDAYRSGFIYTQIARSGTHLNTGVNGYQAEFSHDVIGILANLFTQGDDDNGTPCCWRLGTWWDPRVSTKTASGPTHGRGPST